LCPPLTKRKAGRPRVSRFKAWFEKGRSSKKAKKDEKPKRSQKGNKIGARFVRNLGTELGLPYAVTLLKEQSMSFYCYCFVAFFTY
jgi:hypothetical protein